MSLKEKTEALLSPQAPRSGGDCSVFCNSLLAAHAGCERPEVRHYHGISYKGRDP